MDSSFTSTASRGALIGLLVSTGLAGVYAGCGGTDSSNQTTGSAAGTGGSESTSSVSSASSASGAGGSGGAASTTSASSSAATTSAATTGSGTSTSGAGGGPAVWPTCDAPEPGAVLKTLHQVWQDNPAAPKEIWSPGLFVTGVSKGGCQAGVACQIFVQQAESFADLTAATQQSLKMFISANTAIHFLNIKVGDKVDVDAHAWRYNVNGENELLLQVSLALPGCAKVVGSGKPAPVPAKLSDLSIAAYEDTTGPVLVTLTGVQGKPQMPAETFVILPLTGSFGDAGVETLTSLSPYFMPGGVFTGYATTNPGATHKFATVTGVFGIFIPTGSTSKYEEVYPRAESEYPAAP